MQDSGAIPTSPPQYQPSSLSSTVFADANEPTMELDVGWLPTRPPTAMPRENTLGNTRMPSSPTNPWTLEPEISAKHSPTRPPTALPSLQTSALEVTVETVPDCLPTAPPTREPEP